MKILRGIPAFKKARMRLQRLSPRILLSENRGDWRNYYTGWITPGPRHLEGKTFKT